jgi:hypothetical protein
MVFIFIFACDNMIVKLKELSIMKRNLLTLFAMLSTFMVVIAQQVPRDMVVLEDLTDGVG